MFSLYLFIHLCMETNFEDKISILALGLKTGALGKMVQQLQKGLTMECAQALHRYGLTRDPETSKM